MTEYSCYRLSYPNGSFYIGSTTSSNLNKYFSDKHKFLILRHKEIEKYKKQDVKQEILCSNFKNEQEMRDYEFDLIKKNIKKEKCLNNHLQAANQKQIAEDNTCPECGGQQGLHKKSCPLYKKPEPCPICGCIFGHTKDCVHAVKCPECGCYKGHLKICSYYTTPDVCPKCGAKGNRHKKGCPDYVEPKSCEICGRTKGHYKTCPLYKPPTPCEECRGLYGHKKFCSQYKEKSKPICGECGGKNNRHKKTCSLYKPNKLPPPCKECGGINGKHKKDCSKYKIPKVCSECGGKQGHHYTSCSKFKSRLK